MALKKPKVPDLLSDLPSGDSTPSRPQSHGEPQTKAKSAVAKAPAAAPSSAHVQASRTGDSSTKSQSAGGGGRLLASKAKRPSLTAAASNTDTTPQTASSEQTAELTFKELLEISMEESAQKVFDLDLRQKQLKCVPFAIKEFKRLKILDLSSNTISEISNLFDNKELKELKLYDNLITSVCLLDSLKDLSSLQLQYNKIRKIGTGLSPLKKLNSLRLNNNELVSLEVREMAPLSQLVYLDVSFNHLKDITAVVSLPNLEELWADNNALESLPDFSRCKKLRDLHVSHNRLTSLAALRSTPLLEELDASQNQLDEFPANAALQRLTSLCLGANRLADFAWLPAICPAVYTLDLSDNGPAELDDRLAATLARLENLFELSFTNCQTPVAAVQRLLPSLDYFNGFTLNRPSSAASSGGGAGVGGQHQQPHQRGGAPPPMRPMSAASAVTARQVENQLRSLESRTESMEAQTEQAFLHLRSRLGQQLAAPAPAAASAAADNDDEEEPPLTGRMSRHSRLRDALEFGRHSRVM